MTFLWLMWVHFLLIHKFCLSSRLVLKMKKIWLIPYVLRMMQKLASTRFQYCRHSSLTSPRTCTSRRATNHSPFTTTVEATRKSCSCKSDAIPSSSTPHRTPLRSSPQQTPHHHPHLILPHSHLDVLPPPPRPCHARHRVWSSFAQSHWNVHRPSTSHHTHLRHHLPLHSQQAQIHLASIHTLKSSGLRDAAASNARGGELGTQMNPFPWKHPRLHPTDPPPPPKKRSIISPLFLLPSHHPVKEEIAGPKLSPLVGLHYVDINFGGPLPRFLNRFIPQKDSQIRYTIPNELLITLFTRFPMGPLSFSFS